MRNTAFNILRLDRRHAMAAGALFLSTASILALNSPGFANETFSSKPTNSEPFRIANHNDGKIREGNKLVFGSNPSLVADIAEEVAPSVVNIDVEKTRKIHIQDFPTFPFSEDLMKRFFGFDGNNSPFQSIPGQNGEKQRVINGNGSGVIVDTQGHILTNNHVVSTADKITVTLNDGRKFPATVIGRDPFSDMAVLKIDAPNLKPAVMGNSGPLRPGEFVLAIGSPLGFDHTVTLGIISAKSRRVPDLNSNVEFIQTDAAINPGNSGGPLVNLRGEVIGINTAISGLGQNIGFAIPVDVAKQVTKELVSTGSITRPWIGLAMTELNPELAKTMGLKENLEGVVVSQVMPNSPSAQAGFRQGDVIQSVDGEKILTAKAIQELVRTKPLHSSMNFKVLRDGQSVALSVKTDKLPEQVVNPKALQRLPGPAPLNPGLEQEY